MPTTRDLGARKPATSRAVWPTLSPILIALGLNLAGPAAAQSQGETQPRAARAKVPSPPVQPIQIWDARIEGGDLRMSGSVGKSGVTVILDDDISVLSDRRGRFEFRLPYRPATCVAMVKAGENEREAVVANCAPEGLPARRANRAPPARRAAQASRDRPVPPGRKAIRARRVSRASRARLGQRVKRVWPGLRARRGQRASRASRGNRARRASAVRRAIRDRKVRPPRRCRPRSVSCGRAPAAIRAVRSPAMRARSWPRPPARRAARRPWTATRKPPARPVAAAWSGSAPGPEPDWVHPCPSSQASIPFAAARPLAKVA